MRPFLTLITAFLCFGMVYGQSISSINPNIAQQGQTINVSISGTGVNFTGASQARLRMGTAHIPSTSVVVSPPSQISALFSIPPGATLGNYDVTVNGSGAAPLVGGFAITAGGGSGSYAYLSGKVYGDQSGPCTFNPGDTRLANRVVKIMPGPYFVNTDAFGNWGAWVNTGSYTVEYIPGVGYANTCNPSNTLSVNATIPNDTVFGVDFPLEFVPYHDVGTFVWSDPARPGFNHQWHVNVTNDGNVNASGVLKFLPDSVGDYKSSIPAGTLSGDTVVWNFSGLAPGGSLHFRVRDSLPATLILGSQITGKSWVELTSGLDAVMTNNQFTLNQTVTGSYDPNDKQSFDEGGRKLNGQILVGDSIINYLIRFQNTGTDTAFNIAVRDTLDPNLDIASFKTMTSSHPYVVSLSGTGAVEWYFPNILLEDSTRNEPESHGFVSYKIKFDPNSFLGVHFENTAHIYFDFNAPIVTNTTSDTIVAQVGVFEPTPFEGLQIAPNPSSGRFTISGNLEEPTALSMDIISLDGKSQTIFQNRFLSGAVNQTFMIEGYPSGIYFVRLSSAGHQKVFKVILTK